VCQVGNGASIFLWHDKWWGPNPLSNFIPREAVDQAGLSQSMKVNEMVFNGQWTWPDNWCNDYSILLTIPNITLNSNSVDKYLWSTNDGKCGNYSTNKAWKDLRQCGDKVEWYEIVWFSNCTPKHSFILWIAMLGRLSTQERLKKWYPNKEMKCSLCGKCLDSLNHLFFECSYSIKVWKAVKDKASMDSIHDKWDEIVIRMTSVKHNRSIKSVLSRIILAACVYFIWNERNKRLFTDENINSKELTLNVINHVRIKLSSQTVKKSIQVAEVCKKWEVVMKERV
jgi:hypothetical protein